MTVAREHQRIPAARSPGPLCTSHADPPTLHGTPRGLGRARTAPYLRWPHSPAPGRPPHGHAVLIRRDRIPGANLPACHTSPPCQTATCANSRCTSSPIHRRSPTTNSVCVSTTASPPDDHHRDDHHRDRERVGETTPTDSRAQRNRAGRRGGHLLTRALSPPNNTGLPTLLHSRRPCPGRSHRKPTTPRLTSEEADGTGGAVGLSYRLPMRSSLSTSSSGKSPRPADTFRRTKRR
jgi:hypothetical protein